VDLTPEELCRDWPDGLTDVRHRIALLRKFEALFAADETLKQEGVGEAPPPELPGYSIRGGAGQRAAWAWLYRAWEQQLEREGGRQGHAGRAEPAAAGQPPLRPGGATAGPVEARVPRDGLRSEVAPGPAVFRDGVDQGRQPGRGRQTVRRRSAGCGGTDGAGGAGWSTTPTNKGCCTAT